MKQADLDALADKLLTQSVESASHVQWNGWCCEYHDGFEDGIDVFIQHVLVKYGQ